MRASVDRLMTWLVSERWRVMLAALVVTLVVAVAKLITGLLLLHDPWAHKGLLVTDSLLSGAFAGLLVGILLNLVRGRRRRLIEYVRRVAELNHHVRNAMQVIVYQTKMRTPDPAQAEEIQMAVRRVDAALHEIFPILGGDRRTDMPGNARKTGPHDLIH